LARESARGNLRAPSRHPRLPCPPLADGGGHHHDRTGRDLELEVSFSSPTNSRIVRYLEARARSPRAVSVARTMPSVSPESLTDPYHDLGTHPDVVERLWDELTVRLPARCRWVVYGAPVLVRPSSGVIFTPGWPRVVAMISKRGQKGRGPRGALVAIQPYSLRSAYLQSLAPEP
jgi:hypothetical protein